MHTPRIQNMSIDELVKEADDTENEVALKIYEMMGGDGFNSIDDDEYEYEE